jgi:hypothetical protein
VPVTDPGVDLNKHKVGTWTVADFPYLNKRRLKLGNRGLWRVCFTPDLKTIYGIYDEHDNNLHAWNGDGLASDTAR